MSPEHVEMSAMQKWATLPNVISAAGAILSINGARNLDTPLGVAEATTGRLLDLADGAVARATGQTSEIGAGLDAGFDKLSIAAIGYGLWRQPDSPHTALAAMAIHNVYNAGITLYETKKRGSGNQAPTVEGKYAMASQNAALGAYVVGGILQTKGHERSARAMRLLGHANAIIGTGYYGVKASMQYTRRALAPKGQQ